MIPLPSSIVSSGRQCHKNMIEPLENWVIICVISHNHENHLISREQITFTGISGSKQGVCFVDVFQNKKTLLSLRTLSYYQQLAMRLLGFLFSNMCINILHRNVLPIHGCSLWLFSPIFKFLWQHLFIWYSSNCMTMYIII